MSETNTVTISVERYEELRKFEDSYTQKAHILRVPPSVLFCRQQSNSLYIIAPDKALEVLSKKVYELQSIISDLESKKKKRSFWEIW
jgi:hypothetical protein